MYLISPRKVKMIILRGKCRINAELKDIWGLAKMKQVWKFNHLNIPSTIKLTNQLFTVVFPGFKKYLHVKIWPIVFVFCLLVNYNRNLLQLLANPTKLQLSVGYVDKSLW